MGSNNMGQSKDMESGVTHGAQEGKSDGRPASTTSRSSAKDTSFSSSNTEAEPKLKLSCEIHADAFRLLVLLALVIGAFFSGLVVNMPSPSFTSKGIMVKSHKPGRATNATDAILELGWSAVIEDFRKELGAISLNLKTNKSKALLSDVNGMGDVSPFYGVIDNALDTIGVRGVFDDAFDGMQWYFPKELKSCSHGIGCKWEGFWWVMHYVGAITAEKLFNDGSLLVDPFTGERVYDGVSFMKELHRIQEKEYTGEMSFHSEHAFIWHYVAKTMPDLDSYPVELTNEFCGEYLLHGHRSHSARKTIGLECYHGFGHAIFFVHALRQIGANPDDLTAMRQFRPKGGFQLSNDVFCDAYRVCLGAPNTTTQPRKRCVGGIRHSTKLLWKPVKGMKPEERVTEIEQYCDIAEEVLEGLVWTT
uniref:Uncharacterized protein n=1 Tax=Grammatophora oceanica TaxID=210454 RepID=A0A6U5KEB2_9STRA